MFDVREMDKQKPYTSIIFHLFCVCLLPFPWSSAFTLYPIYSTECSSFAIISNSVIFLCRIFFPLPHFKSSGTFFLLLSFFSPLFTIIIWWILSMCFSVCKSTINSLSSCAILFSGRSFFSSNGFLCLAAFSDGSFYSAMGLLNIYIYLQRK